MRVAAISALFMMGCASALSGAVSPRHAQPRQEVEIPLEGPITIPEAEISGMTWFGDQVILLLFGTGIRGGTDVRVRIGGGDAQVLGFAPSSEFVGLDQVNVVLSRALIGRGEVEVELIVDGVVANTVTISIA